MPNTVISYPIPLYQNVPIHAEYYEPRVFFISGIMLGYVTTVVTTVDHNYVIGQLVRLLIPTGFGSTELNEMLGYVTNIPASNQVTLTINSTNANPFINANLKTKPQIVAVGDINSGVLNTNGRSSQVITIPGSFTNISP